MNELYNTVTSDFTSFLIFSLMVFLFSFSASVLVCSVAKTIVDYYFFQKINFIKFIATIEIPTNQMKADWTDPSSEDKL
jgi:hypothetical protein